MSNTIHDQLREAFWHHATQINSPRDDFGDWMLRTQVQLRVTRHLQLEVMEGMLCRDLKCQNHKVRRR